MLLITADQLAISYIVYHFICSRFPRCIWRLVHFKLTTRTNWLSHYICIKLVIWRVIGISRKAYRPVILDYVCQYISDSAYISIVYI